MLFDSMVRYSPTTTEPNRANDGITTALRESSDCSMIERGMIDLFTEYLHRWAWYSDCDSHFDQSVIDANQNK